MIYYSRDWNDFVRLGGTTFGGKSGGYNYRFERPNICVCIQRSG